MFINIKNNLYLYLIIGPKCYVLPVFGSEFGSLGELAAYIPFDIPATVHNIPPFLFKTSCK